MAQYQSRNIIVGAAAIFISRQDSTVEGTESQWTSSPVGPALPTWKSGVKAEDSLLWEDPSIASPVENTNWRSMGYTTDGIEVSYEPDYGEVTVDQALDSVKMFKQGMRVSVNTTLSEATLENLLVAWGQQSETLDGTEGADQTLAIASGDLGDDPVERSLAFAGPAPRGTDNKQRERIYHVRRALQVETSAHSLSRADATTFPVSFRAMPDPYPAASGQDYGVIVQRVITTA